MAGFVIDKEEFTSDVVEFFGTLFPPDLGQKIGEIELRTFKPNGQDFFSSKREAADWAYDLCNQGTDIYFGVNPRIGRKGKKENIRYLTCFHAEIDYGNIGHNKIPKYIPVRKD